MHKLNFKTYSKNGSQIRLFQDKLGDQIDNWDFAGLDTQYLTHSLHPYLASMIPQISDKLIKMYMKRGEKLLDPFVGGGSVIVEGYLNGMESYGFDVNPLAMIISKAKTTKINETSLKKIKNSLTSKILAYNGDIIAFKPEQRMDFWFLPYMLRPLSAIIKSINEICEVEKDKNVDFGEKVENFLKCVFSRTVRDVSLTYRGEVRLRRLQGKDLENFRPDVTETFVKRLNEGVDLVSRLPDGIRPVIDFCDVRKLPYEDKFFSTIITSPPYGDVKNTIPYNQFSKNMLYWLDIENGPEIIKRFSLGFIEQGKTPPQSSVLKSVLSKMKKENLITEAICFYRDYYDALKEMTRVTKKRIIIVIGHRVLEGLFIDNPEITMELMAALNWHLEAMFKRDIRKKRISRKMGFGHNAKGGTIDKESILVYSPV